MKQSSSTKEQITDAACARICASGVAGITVAQVAAAAGVSSALVHYHFATKRQLLAAAARRLAARRTAGRLAALAVQGGLATLDALWDTMSGEALDGAERTWHQLVLLASRDPAIREELRLEREAQHRHVTAALPRLLADLESAPSAPSDELAGAIITFLDGAALALAAGAEHRSVRSAFDAFWLLLAAAGQRPPGR